jgi:hypothetical protein
MSWYPNDLTREKSMPYSAQISRDNPTAFLFIIDQSGSMDEKAEGGRSKAQFVADVLNRTLYTLVMNCTKADGVRGYFDVGVLAYSGSDVMTGELWPEVGDGVTGQGGVSWWCSTPPLLQ